MKKIKSNCAGYDNIKPNNIKHMKGKLCFILKEQINYDIKFANYPKELKNISITPIHKGGDRNNSNNYRPLCISTCFSKIYDNILNMKLEKYIENNEILSNNQYAYRKHHSCTRALIKTMDNVYKKLDEGNIVVLVFLDLTQAFPSLNHNILLQKLKDIGLNNNELLLMQNYMIKTKHITKLRKTNSQEKEFKNGVWQGSCLASTLFNIYINDITKIEEEMINIYADDIMIEVHGKDINEINKKSENIMNRINEYCNNNCLKLNFKKCKYMKIKERKKYKDEEITIKIGSNNIEEVKSYKYLGITIDNKLNWNEHINKLIKKIQKYIPIFYNIRNYTKQQVSIQLYKTLVLSNINYGIQIYGNRGLEKIQKITNRILGIISFSNDKKLIQNIKKDNNILEIQDYNRIEWIKLCHDIIHNSKLLPKYFRKIIELKETRNGITIKTNYRKSNYGNKISYNLMEQIWNKIDIKNKKIQDKNLLIYEIKNNIIKNYK